MVCKLYLNKVVLKNLDLSDSPKSSGLAEVSCSFLIKTSVPTLLDNDAEVYHAKACGFSCSILSSPPGHQTNIYSHVTHNLNVDVLSA